MSSSYNSLLSSSRWTTGTRCYRTGSRRTSKARHRPGSRRPHGLAAVEEAEEEEEEEEEEEGAVRPLSCRDRKQEAAATAAAALAVMARVLTPF